MSYDAFLLVMSQLAGKKKARVVIQGLVIFFEPSHKQNHWVLSTQIFSGEGYLPSSVRSCVSSGGMLRWQHRGAYLKLDPKTHSVHLIEEIQMEENQYIPFKSYLNEFLSVATEWKDILHELADRDSVFAN
jgi:hypothetical protein